MYIGIIGSKSAGQYVIVSFVSTTTNSIAEEILFYFTNGQFVRTIFESGFKRIVLLQYISGHVDSPFDA